MKLADMTWQEVEACSKDVVVVIPTGSLEQHGPHLPLFTDSLLVTAVAEAAEQQIPEKLLLTPTLWLGASGHHSRFPGTLSASFEGYEDAIQSVVNSLAPHGFTKFFVLNGHGGNSEPNGVAMRKLKAQYPDLTFGHIGYFSLIERETSEILTGPMKSMGHACEAEASLMMHIRPDLVRTEKLRDDGLRTEPALQGMVLHFDEITEQGSRGYASLATAQKGERLFNAAVEATTKQLTALAKGFLLVGYDSRE